MWTRGGPRSRSLSKARLFASSSSGWSTDTDLAQQNCFLSANHRDKMQLVEQKKQKQKTKCTIENSYDILPTGTSKEEKLAYYPIYDDECNFTSVSQRGVPFAKSCLQQTKCWAPSKPKPMPGDPNVQTSSLPLHVSLCRCHSKDIQVAGEFNCYSTNPSRTNMDQPPNSSKFAVLRSVVSGLWTVYMNFIWNLSWDIQYPCLLRVFQSLSWSPHLWPSAANWSSASWQFQASVEVELRWFFFLISKTLIISTVTCASQDSFICITPFFRPGARRPNDESILECHRTALKAWTPIAFCHQAHPAGQAAQAAISLLQSLLQFQSLLEQHLQKSGIVLGGSYRYCDLSKLLKTHHFPIVRDDQNYQTWSKVWTKNRKRIKNVNKIKNTFNDLLCSQPWQCSPCHLSLHLRYHHLAAVGQAIRDT